MPGASIHVVEHMDGKKTIALDPKVYQKLLAIKKGGEQVEDVVARLVEAHATGVESARWHVPCKVIVLGPPASGKSMLVKFFFENKDPKLILADFLIPTKETEEITYDWLDLKVSVVDVGHDDFEPVIKGQQPEPFSGVCEIIYVFDIGTWSAQKTLIVSDIDALLATRAQRAPDAGITCLVHKKDTAEGEAGDNIVTEFKALLKGIKGASTIHVEATSLLARYAMETFRAFRNVLLRHSSLLRQALLPGYTRT